MTTITQADYSFILDGLQRAVDAINSEAETVDVEPIVKFWKNYETVIERALSSTSTVWFRKEFAAHTGTMFMLLRGVAEHSYFLPKRAEASKALSAILHIWKTAKDELVIS